MYRSAAFPAIKNGETNIVGSYSKNRLKNQTYFTQAYFCLILVLSMIKTKLLKVI